MSLQMPKSCTNKECRVRMFDIEPKSVHGNDCPSCGEPGVESCGNCGGALEEDKVHVYNSMGSCWIERKVEDGREAER